MADIEQQSERTPDGSVWIGAAEHVEGTVSSEPGPGRILFVDTPRPEHIRTGFDLIVCRGGSRFSHAALVCRQRGVKALFGTGVTLQDGDTVHIGADGSILF